MPYKSRWSVPFPECSLPTFLLQSAEHNEEPEVANKPCYIEVNDPENEYLTRATYKSWAQRLALGITRLPHFKPGERILVFSGTSLCFPVAFMGIIMAGGIFTAANPAYTARELAYQLKDSGACYVLVMDAGLDAAVEAAETAGLPLDRVKYIDVDILVGRDVSKKASKKGVGYWGSMFASKEEGEKYQWPELKGKDEAKNTLIALNYSSGTTGVPKGVMITHRGYVSNCIQHQHLATLRSDFKERNERAKFLCFVPLYHAMGQTIFLAGAVMRHVPVYLMPKFDFIQVLEAIQRFRITEFTMVPPIAVMVAKHPAVKKYDLSSIDAIGSGAAPLSAGTSREVEKVWDGRLNLKQGWGMTEVTCSLLGWDPNKWSDSFAVGEPNANTTAKIMKVNDKSDGTQTFEEITSQGPEHTGELWCQGPNIMKGYWKNPKATKETFSPDGQWLRTGDIAYVDKEGHFFIVDRIKELIKVKGNQVAPAELEALILDHPGVSDVAVIGIQTQDGDEKPRAFCVRSQREEGKKVTEDDIAKFVEGKVIRYKRLTGGVHFVDAIPKNPSGKILRRQLRDQAKKVESRSEGAKL